MLLQGLLEGRRVALVQADGIGARLTELRAAVETLPADALADEPAAAAWARERAPLHGLVVDAAATFGEGGAGPLQATLDLAWRAARGVATGTMIEQAEPGRLVLVAPRPEAGDHADAARAGLENLARTLSVEWARFQITAVTIAPGPGTAEAEVAELAAFIISRAGGYLSGCRLDLGLVAQAS